MSTYCNGSVVKDFEENNGDNEKVYSNLDHEIPSKQSLKGFDKIPKVKVEKFDITPYLVRMGSAEKNWEDPENSGSGGKSEYDREHSRTGFGNTENNYDNAEVNSENAEAGCEDNENDTDSDHDSDKLPLKLHKSFFFSSVTLVRDNLSKLQESLKTTRILNCKFCDKIYYDDKKLKNHHDNKHLIVYGPLKTPKKVSFSDKVVVHELKEYHKCRKCSRIYESYKMLKTHMKESHKKRKCYICHYCHKSFVDRSIFKVHIKLHCDACGYLAETKTEYTHHRRYVCVIKRSYKCTTCYLSFCTLEALRDHSNEHISPYLICFVCKEQFETKCYLAHHIAYLHSKKQTNSLYQTVNLSKETLYLCNFCELTSVDKNVIEAHTKLLPDLTKTDKNTHLCDQCNKQFGSEKELLQHVWTHFLKPAPANIVTKPHENLTYDARLPVPKHMLPTIVLKKLDMETINNWKKGTMILNGKGFKLNFIDVSNQDGSIKTDLLLLAKPRAEPKYKCDFCEKRLVSKYNVRRHINKVHFDLSNCRCRHCDEVFVWPSLLLTHKCIRNFNSNDRIAFGTSVNDNSVHNFNGNVFRSDVRERNFLLQNNVNGQELNRNDVNTQVSSDTLSCEVSSAAEFNDMYGPELNEMDDYTECEFEMPAPIVEFRELETSWTPVGDRNVNIVSNPTLQLVFNEVPVEFS